MGDIMSKESFKMFARNHPELVNVVIKGNASWQQLYEIYEIYGENNSIWNRYFNMNSNSNNLNSLSDGIISSTNTIKELVSSFKNIDMDSVQKGIDNIQKTIGLLQDIGFKNK